MKKWLIIAICLACSPCQAIEAPPKYLNTWGGLDTYQDSAKVADTDATALSNVLTDRGFLEKRTGSEYYLTLLAGWKVEYLKEFIGSSGTRYLLGHSSSTVYYTDTSAAFAAISTTTLGYNLDCTSAFGRLHCADGFATPWSWNSSVVSRSTSSPICTFLEFADERLYCANTTEGESRVHASAFGDPDDWTIPTTLTADSPSMFTFQRTDGEGITCFKVTPWGKFVGKRHSTHILKGEDNDTYYKRIIDPVIGCIDDRSVQMVDGMLMWLGLEGVYVWGGSGKPELISKDIDSDIKSARQMSSNKANWINSSQTDWESGLLTASGAGAPISTEILPGSITPSSWTAVDTSSADFVQGTVSITTTSNPTELNSVTLQGELFDDGDYTQYPSSWTVYAGSWTVSNGYMEGLSASGNRFIYAMSKKTVGSWGFDLYRPANGSVGFAFMGDSAAFITGGYYVVSKHGVNGTLGISDDLYSDICNIPNPNAPSPTQADNTWVRGIVVTRDASGNFTLTTPLGSCSGSSLSRTESTVVGINTNIVSGTTGGAGGRVDNIYGVLYHSTGTFTSRIFNTTLSTPVAGPLDVTVSTPAGSSINFYVRSSSSSNNDLWGAWEASSDTLHMTTTQQYWQYMADFSTSYSSQTPVLSDVTLVARTTAEYWSDIKFIETISDWMSFDANDTDGGGNLTYYTRASTGSFSKLSSTPAWVAQGNNLKVAADVGNYYQWKVLFTVTSGTNTPSVESVTTNWQEGAAGSVASMVWDHRYHLCVMNSSTTLVNDRCWVYQKNKKWTHFDGPNYSALELFNNEPLAGSANTDSYVYKIMRPGVYSDNGVAIDAYWETPDYTWEQPNHTKTLRNVWIDAEYDSGGVLSVGYAMNKSSVFTSTTTTLDSTVGYVSKKIDNLVDGYALGRYVRLRFGNDILDRYFRLNTSTIYGEVDPLISD